MRLAAAALALALALPAAAEPRLVVAFDDPAGDAYGPGTYQPPGDTQFHEGDFDLRRFAVLVDGDEVVFEITLGAVVRLPDTTWRTNRTQINFLNGIYLQNIDVYLDTERKAPGGLARGIPGRRVAFAGNRTWERAVVITPQPGPAREVIADTLGAQMGRVAVVDGVLARGRTVIARIPAAALGGLPQPGWGYSVHLSGASWDLSFEAVDRLRDSREVNAFTMPVTTVREAWAFGGAPANSRAHPRVVDVILPPGVDQRKVLGSFDVKSDAYARVPFVYADGSDPFTIEGLPAGAAAGTVLRTDGPAVLLPDILRARPLAGGSSAPAIATASPGAWTVADVSGDLVTISGPTTGVAPLRIGRVLDAEGRPVASVVVGRVLENGITASIVDGRERVVRGAAVRFDPP